MKKETFDSILESEKELPRTNGLHEAIIKVMKKVKNIDKSMTVGSGSFSYKGVADKDVKNIIGSAMAENNLTCLPIDIQPKVQIDRWEEGSKQKQSVFTEVIAKFKITHSLTNESIVIVGYGHGVDAQDKSAGKATTYALKNALLYSYLVPTGAIDDTDNTHSNDAPVPLRKKPLLEDTKIAAVQEAIAKGTYTAEQINAMYQLSNDQKLTLGI